VGKGENSPNERIVLMAGTVRGAKDLDPKRVFVVTRSGAGGEVNVPGDAPETKREPTQPRKEAAKTSSGSEGPGPKVASGSPRAEPLKPVNQPNTREDKGRKEREFPRERSERDVAACQGSPCPAPPRQVRGQSEVVKEEGSPQAMGKRVDEYGNEVDNVEGGEGELGQQLQRSEQPDQIGKGDTASSSCEVWDMEKVKIPVDPKGLMVLHALPPENSWDLEYSQSVEWGEQWRATLGGGSEWPKGIRIHGNRMISDGKICVPEARVGDMIREHHKVAGHCGVKRLIREMGRRLIFPRTTKLFEETRKVRQSCPVCQARDPPN